MDGALGRRWRAVERIPDSAAWAARKRKSIDCAFSELRAMIVVVRCFCCEKWLVGCRGEYSGCADVERGFGTVGETENTVSNELSASLRGKGTTRNHKCGHAHLVQLGIIR